MLDREKLAHLLENKQYNQIDESFILDLCDADGKFVEEECLLFDYKDHFPHGRSDEYWGGIIRLLCSFHNTYGGVIIFGVHDSSRDSGYNNIPVNIESLNSVLCSHLSARIECVHKKIVNKELPFPIDVDILIIPKRAASAPPIVSTRDYGKYTKNKYWFRPNHEVQTIQSSDLPFIFSARDYQQQYSNDYQGIEGSYLPDNPSTLPSFIGRINILSQLWKWLFQARHIKKYLYGDGGSGKSTISYEFAELVANNARHIKSEHDKTIDIVIWLSAKRRQLDPDSITITKSNSDFNDSVSLYQSILVVSNLFTSEQCNEEDKEKLISSLEQLFEMANIFLIIDDIDTLITDGIDTGTDALEEVILLSRSYTKILYTQRNLPSHSRNNALSVPGFEYDEEYAAFINQSIEHFHVTEPDEKTKKKIWELSDGRPLIIEVLIGLRRRFPSYADSIAAFTDLTTGQDTLKYMYDREYQFLENKYSKDFLAALFLWDKPVTFEEIAAILLISADEISNVIVEVNEIFLSHHHDVSDQTKYSLNTFAKHYISNMCITLPYFERIKERVNNKKSGKLKFNPIIDNLIRNTKIYLNKSEEKLAYNLVFEEKYDPKVTEHPEFIALQGKVAMSQRKPDRQLVRSCLEKATNLNTISVGLFWDWLTFEEAEKDSNDYCRSICDRLIEHKGYKFSDKAKLASKKAVLLADKARHYCGYSYATERQHYLDSIKTNLEAYHYTIRSRTPDRLKYAKHTKTSIYYFYKCCLENQDIKHFMNEICKIINQKNICDPIHAYFKDNYRAILQDSRSKNDMMQGLLNMLKNEVNKNSSSFETVDTHKGMLAIIDRMSSELR